MVKVSLQCVVVGVAGSAFPIDIGKNLLVGHLKEAIKEKNDEIKCPARDLQLFLAKSGDNAWLASSTDHVKKLKKGEKTAYIEALIHENKELPKKDPISKYLEHMDEPQMEQIHVLVVVPQQWTSTTVVSQERDVKRLKKEENIPLEALWEYSALKITAFPQLDELSSLLQRPLPFQVEVQKFLTMKTMFDPNGPFLVCEDLSTLINAFSLSCDRRYRPDPMASVKIWQHLYNHLLDISYHLCKAYMFDVVSSRKRVDTSKTTARTRPDFLLHYLGMVLFRGEERNAATDIDVVCKKMTNKMLSWNPIFYGDLPYTLGYATSGERLRVVMIDRQRHPYTILEFQSIFQQRTEVIKMFYNLPFFFHKMSILAKRTCPSSLMPFTPDENDKRKIELMDGVIVRTIERNQCRNGADFKRLADIYVTLEDLNNRVHERTHLQIVRSLEIKKRLLRVHLSQLGTVRPPLSVDEVRVWLQGMLTALKYWHSCNYCHGDLRWSNIIHIPDSDSGFWVLIDMDESRKPNTTTIDWNHKFHGHKLIFEHDFYQLGKLMNSLTLSLPSDLVDVQKVLLSAVDTQVDDLPTLLMNQLQY